MAFQHYERNKSWLKEKKEEVFTLDIVSLVPFSLWTIVKDMNIIHHRNLEFIWDQVFIVAYPRKWVIRF